MEVASTFRSLYMQLSFQRAELKPANIHLPLPGKWIDTLVLNFSWFCQIFCFDFNDCCVSYLTTIFIMLQVADLFLDATKKKVNSLVSRTPRITHTVTVIETFFITSLCTLSSANLESWSQLTNCVMHDYNLLIKHFFQWQITTY